MTRFNPLDHPIIFRTPELWHYESSWIEHLPFAFLLMELARPKLVVELGAHHGISYCGFCQAVTTLQLPAQCVAVDTWQGDPQTGFYASQVLANLRAHHDPRYSAFSRLLQSSFDQALPHFPDGSIDLLHIDGLHTLEAVTHDFETWRPKLSGAGVVLFHDTNVTAPGYRVHEFWDRLETQFPSFEFKHSNGLGVLAVGRSVPAPVLEFLDAARHDPEVVRTFFATVGRKSSLRCNLSTVLNVTSQQRALISQLMQQLGAPAAPPETTENILQNPVLYTVAAAREVEAVANALLQTRQALASVQGSPQAAASGISQAGARQ